MTKTLLAIRHVAFEDLGGFEAPLKDAGYAVRYADMGVDAIADFGDPDLLVVLGGPIGVYEDDLYPWLKDEIAYIAARLKAQKPTLGICLGAQLIADAMGGNVYQNTEFEIGWFPVRAVGAMREHPLFRGFPVEFTALHWHGDTFDLPPGATLLASTDACTNQAFICEGNVVGLQFHAEVRPEDVRTFVQGETDPLPEGRYVQTFEEILAGDQYIPTVHRLLEGVLNGMTAG